MNASPLIGVVIPVHNTAAYLPACLSSVAGQSYSDFICILVDDGSTDNSAEICRSFSAQDRRFVLSQQNCCGVSAARANGLRIALTFCVEWVAFCDSDDLYHPRLLETLLHAAQSTELPTACCRYDSFSETLPEEIEPPESCETMKFPRHLEALLHDHRVDYSLCNKLYRADCITPAMLDNGYSYNEDLLTNWKVFTAIPGCAFCYFNGYHYRQHSQSASHRPLAPDSIDDQRNVALYIRRHCPQEMQQSADAFYYEKLVYLASMILRRDDPAQYVRQLHELILGIHAGLRVPHMGRNPRLPRSIRLSAWMTVYYPKLWHIICRKMLKDRQ